MNAALNPTLDAALGRIEQHIQALAAAFAGADPALLAPLGSQLRDAVLQLSELARHPEHRHALASSACQPRLAAISSFLSLHRDHLARLSAFNDRQLEAVLPEALSTSTYGQSPSKQAARLYQASR